MNLELKNKVAIVTGSSRGIGKSIAEKLAYNGCKLVIISRKIEDLKKVKDEINSKEILCYECDTTNQSQFKNIAEEVYKKWGSIDILVNNAGITKDKLLLRLNENDWDEVININLKGYYNTIKVISRYMLKNRSGKIINISSVIGQIGNSGQSNYAASKSGIEGMTRALAVELGSKNININCIAPGYIKTEMTNSLESTAIDNMKNNIPLSKLGSSKDIANLTCYLSSELSSYITGQVINVDGGMTIK
jgi:3-oxoacyl-[acyl-carrier protein] reductase